MSNSTVGGPPARTHSAHPRGIAHVVPLVLLAAGVALAGCSSAAAPVSVPSSAPPPDSPTVAPRSAPTAEGAPAGEPAGATGTAFAVTDKEPTSTAEATPVSTAPPRPTITGLVRDANGEGLVDVTVALVEGSVPVPNMAVFTDAEGRYSWTVRPGTYTVEAYRDGYAAKRSEVTVGEGETAEVDFTLERQ